MKLSELTYEYLESVGLWRSYIPTDATDVVLGFSGKVSFELAKGALFENYGDVEIVVYPLAPWYGQIVIVDEQWQADHGRYLKEKAEWCSKYGCN